MGRTHPHPRPPGWGYGVRLWIAPALVSTLHHCSARHIVASLTS